MTMVSSFHMTSLVLTKKKIGYKKVKKISDLTERWLKYF